MKIEGHDVRVMALDGQPAEPFLARNSALVLAPGAGPTRSSTRTLRPGSASPILLHDGKEARPIARPDRLKGAAAARRSPARRPPAAVQWPAGQLDLKNALRIDLTLGGTAADWVAPANFAAWSARVPGQGRPHRGAGPDQSRRYRRVFHLHGHHFRLLDRLDDGWKPFWLDTLAIDSGQTQRIAFAAEYAGRWLMEAAATDWAAPRLVRWYSVE